MSKRTIAKFSLFVISVLALAAAGTACGHVSESRTGLIESNAATSSDYGKPKVVGTIDSKEITESSGIAASRCQADVFWTHNDSGDEAFVFAINRSGKRLGTWRVTNAKNTDWEDISDYQDAEGKCYLYIGEIGDNDQKRDSRAVYRITEPEISAAAANSNKDAPLSTEPASMLQFTYPDSPHNAETMMVNPKNGDLYILTKRFDGPSAIFKIKGDFSGRPVKAEKIGELAVPAIPNGFLTGGAISPDGTRAIICDYTSAYELVLPAGSQNFDDIWKQKPAVVDLGDRKQGEAVTYTADGKAIIATSEKKDSPVIEVDRLR